MRVRVDRGAEAVRLELGAAAETRRVDVADGVAIAYDPAGRIVEIEVHGVDPAALHEFAVELAGLADRPAVPVTAPRAPGISPAGAMREASQPSPEPYGGPLTWDAEAEAAILQVPFFSRGRQRLAASALTRQRGRDKVTIDVVKEVAGR